MIKGQFLWIMTLSGVMAHAKPLYFELENNSEVFCSAPLKDINKKNQVIFFDLTEATHLPLMACLQKRSNGQSTLLLKVTNGTILRPTPETVEFANYSPNIMLVTHNLSTDIFSMPIMSDVFQSHRSYVFIVDTTQSTFFKCVNGNFSIEAYLKIEDFLNTLWQKYFMFHVILELPFACPKVYIIYGPQTIKTDQEVYNRTIQILPTDIHIDDLRSHFVTKKLAKGFPLRANIFNRFPTSITNCDNMHYYRKLDYNLTQGYCGLDAMVMQDVLTLLGFNASFPDVDDKDGYGYYVDDDDVTGSLGHLLRDYFDVSFNSRFMVQYLPVHLQNKIKFLNYVTFDSVCAVMKAPDIVALWHYPHGAFDVRVWTIAITVLLLVAVTAKITAAIKRKLMRKPTNVERLNVIDYVSIGLFGWVVCHNKIRISIPNATTLLTCIVMLSMYQAYINYVYTTQVRINKVHTISDLQEYNFEIYMSASILSVVGGRDAIPIPNSRIHLELFNITSLLSHDNYATLQRKSDIQIETSMNYTTDDGRVLLSVVRECFFSNYISYIARFDFPFGNNIKATIIRLLEAGLPEAYYRWTKNTMNLKTFAKSTEGLEPRPFYTSNLGEHRIPFSLLLFGYFAATCALIVEKWWWRRQNKSEIL